MTLRDVMTTNVKTCSEQHSLQDVAKIMADNHIGFLPVVGSNGELVGTLTDRDIVRKGIAKGASPQSKVADVCSDQPIHLNADADLSEAEHLMEDAHIRRIVIIDEEKRPIGVISAGDIARQESDPDRVKELYSKVCEHTGEERTVETFVGSSYCG